MYMDIFKKKKKKKYDKITKKREYLEVVETVDRDGALWWLELEVMAVVCGGHNWRLGRAVCQGNGSC